MLPFVRAWINLKGVTEKRQTPYDLISLWNQKKKKKSRKDTGKRLVVARDGVWGVGRMSVGIKRYKLPVIIK